MFFFQTKKKRAEKKHRSRAIEQKRIKQRVLNTSFTFRPAKRTRLNTRNVAVVAEND